MVIIYNSSAHYRHKPSGVVGAAGRAKEADAQQAVALQLSCGGSEMVQSDGACQTQSPVSLFPFTHKINLQLKLRLRLVARQSIYKCVSAR